MSASTVVLERLETYSDDRGNVIEYDGPAVTTGVTVTFVGRNNRLTVANPIRLGTFRVRFDRDNAHVDIGPNRIGGHLRLIAQLGEDSRITIGEHVTAVAPVVMTAVEGSTLHVGNDVMIAPECHLRCDDAHPIFDVRTQLRVNPAKDIVIGHHVWLAHGSMVLGGSHIEDGSVIGMASLVKGHVPNNCVAAGSPARVIRRDIAWERPHLSRRHPGYKPDSSTVTKSEYWALTHREPSRLQRTYHRLPVGVRRAVRRLLGRPVA